VQLSYCTLRAPVAGQVASVDVEVNENVSAGQKVFLLTAGSDIEVEVALPGALIADVRVGQRVEVDFTALPERRFEAEVTEAGVAAVGTATTFPVTVQLAETDRDIRSGMAAEVAFRFETASEAGRVLVPAVSVGEDRDGRYVFVIERGDETQGVVRRRSVTVGELTADGIEVLSGLEEGELVATAGVRRLVDGEEVKLQS
jgi:RND family efflux transporter MFP subunit